jgi:hypothetical protein
MKSTCLGIFPTIIVARDPEVKNSELFSKLAFGDTYDYPPSSPLIAHDAKRDDHQPIKIPKHRNVIMTLFGGSESLKLREGTQVLLTAPVDGLPVIWFVALALCCS